MDRAQNLNDAIAGIKPIPFSDGPNFYSADVVGWSISAPTRQELIVLLLDWFSDDDATSEADG